MGAGAGTPLAGVGAGVGGAIGVAVVGVDGAAVGVDVDTVPLSTAAILSFDRVCCC